ncbi:signal recognition particle-docking protein FtsY [Chamaesiphon sp.]|uniref:signal recognition particle-docking protein FtsY n=1 Tax=Chamaesiphon sp. TaxID=2814140 RepID=UPI0035931A9A
MVFNWFRRKFDKSESEQVPDSEQVEIPAVVEDEPIEPETSEAGATDYLAWAKAAYQNIQQQQESSSVAVVEADETSSDTSAPVETTDPELLETAGINDVEPETTAPEGEIEVAVDNSAPVKKEAPEATPVVTENIPIWARDDRQQRLEQLKATAIETLEPEAPTPEIALDDDFLWSAKVLADQGRTPEQVSLDEINWLKKLRQGLDKTRRGFVNQFKALIGQGPLNADAVESIETLLLQADVGVEATDYVIETLQAKLRQESLPPEEAVAYLKQILRDLLDKPLQENYTQEFLPIQNQLNIWLLVGVNGVGKTTTIGKLAHMTQASGYKCLIAAGDTFRAAAVQQVQVWGQRSGIEVIANPGQNTDPAAVVYDAISAAQARGTELLLVDTAGRLQNKKNLMDELSKIRRIIDKQATNAQIESLLVLDATLGQNGLRQAQVFAEAAKLSGVVLTKLDGTAKGGVALAVVQQLGLPIRFIGAGEGIEDLRPFSSYEFVEALLSG